MDPPLNLSEYPTHRHFSTLQEPGFFALTPEILGLAVYHCLGLLFFIVIAPGS